MARRSARESQKVVGFAAKKLLPRAQGVKTKIMLGRTLESVRLSSSTHLLCGKLP